MLKELRNWLQMLEDDDIEAAGKKAVDFTTDGATAVESGADTASRSSFILDPDTSSAEMLAGLLTASGLAATRFASADKLLAGFGPRSPELVFIDVSAGGEGAVDALFGLGQRRFAGGVQLMGRSSAQVIETVTRMGQHHALDMLPVLDKPLAASAVRRLLEARGLGAPPVAAATVDLGEALENDWIEFWYQPKINLRKRRIAGVETFARLRHPQLGLVPPGAFVTGASETDLNKLSERALIAALSAANNFSQMGINLRLAVNVPVSALLSLPIEALVAEHGPHNFKWPGLLLDVSEAQLLDNLPDVQAASARFAGFGVKLAIDDFGRGHLPLSQLRELAFAELKLDRGFVADCALDLARASVCRSVIDLAHHMGCVAVAIGVEKADDMRTLADMGCDLGQGYLFGPPMPERDLVALMLARAVVPEAPAQTPQVATVPSGSKVAEARLKRARWN